jgi:transglutaminase-like putative cysteine protease/sugar lactone lactonase YvrE
MLCQPRLAILALFLLSSSLHAHTGEVVRSFPAPGGLSTGVTFDGEQLWIADYGADRLFAIDPASGEVLRDIPSPGYRPAGLTWDGAYLWNVDREQRKIFQLDPRDGTILRVVDSPLDRPEGLAWDGETLWVGDDRAKKLARLDLSDGTAVRTLVAPAKSVNGLTFDGTYLWSSDRTTDELYMIDPESGDVLIVADAPGPHVRGMAWDGEHLWAVDYQQDRVHQLVRQDEELYRLKSPRRALVTFTHETVVQGPGVLKSLDVHLAVPQELPQQKVLSTSFTPDTSVPHEDRWGQPVRSFHHENAPSGSRLRAVMRAEVEISAIRYFVFPDRCGSLDDIPADLRERYTADGSKYQTRDPFIARLSKKIVGDEDNPYYVARRIFDHVRGALEYELTGGWNVAPVVLQRGTGSCSEYTFSFVALCRAAGLPARFVGAIVVRGDDASLDDVYHRWPEVYLPNYGWIPIDPQAGDKSSPRDRALAIGDLSNRFLITTQGGGDSEYLGWYYNAHESYTSDPKVQVHPDSFAEWEPLEEE